MKRFLLIIASFAILQTAVAQNDLLIRAQNICNWFNNNQTDSIVNYFSDEVKSQLSAENLKTIWNQLKAQVGNLNKINAPIIRNELGNFFYTSVFEFDKMKLELRMPFNSQGMLIGLFFAPYQQDPTYTTPTYGKEDYTEEELLIETDGLTLKAFFTKPNKKNFPIVVLVHGSGPHDADETINNYKPFKDIAIGLAQNGIASLRYEKRTYKYKADSLSNTPTKETVIDAVAMLTKATELKGVNKNKIYLLGHSLGGYLCGRIAMQCARKVAINGLILLAAPARNLEDIIYSQYEYILSLDSLDNDEKRKLADLKKQVELVHSGKYSLNTPRENFPLQIPASYWEDLKGYNPVQTVISLNTNVLLLNAGKDYQVPRQDFEIWKNALQNNPKATFYYYPNLFHLFCIGNGTPADYEGTGNVSAEVINDIVNFISEKH
jgi:hypothetical protein